MDIKTPRLEANEIAKGTDFDYAYDREYANLCTILEELFGHLTNDMIVDGLVCQERGTPSMNVDLSIGLGYCKSTGKIAHTGSLFGPIAITNGGSQDRIDLVEIRLKETDYDEQQRAFKDPVTGAISYQDINVKTRFEIETQVIEGTEGAGVAASHTTGWIKITEILVEAGETTSILNADIENCSSGIDGEATTAWTAETTVTFRLKTVEGIKSIFRIKHKEDGDHKDDVIKDQHIDWGTGAGQVSAGDVPIVDAGGLITATEVEAALQEFGNEHQYLVRGFIELNLTEFDTDSVPKIADDSKVEVLMTRVTFSSDTVITGSVTNDVLNYIMISAAGVPEWTATEPVWNSSKQGWYNAGNTKRYIGGCHYFSALTKYLTKWIYVGYEKMFSKIKSLAISLVGTHMEYWDYNGSDIYTTYLGHVEIPVNLPDGIEVTELWVYGEASPTAPCVITLNRSPYTSPATQVLAECLFEVQAGEAVSDTSISYEVINNLWFHYWIKMYQADTPDGTGTRLNAIVIKYK